MPNRLEAPVSRFRAAWLLSLFVLCIVAANAATSRFGFVPVGFGFAATAGTVFAGFTFGLRDLLQDAAGRRATVAAILVGAAISAVASPALALASGSAFLLSELAYYAVYTPLRRRNWNLAVAASNAVGGLIDTALFVGIAFGWGAVYSALPGQIVGKTWATLAVLGFVALWRRVRCST